MGDGFDRYIGKVLRRVRKDRGAQSHPGGAALRWRFTPTAIAGYERGERSVSTSKLVALARVYGTTADRLVAQAERLSSGRSSTALVRSVALATHTPEAEAVRGFLGSLDRRRAGPQHDMISIREGELEVVAMVAGFDPASFRTALEAQGIARAVQDPWPDAS